jgi:hypothetical protein
MNEQDPMVLGQKEFVETFGHESPDFLFFL